MRGEFAQNDAFLDLVTEDLAAMLARFDALVAAHVPAAACGVSDESAVIEVLLGAIALRAKLGERLAVGGAAREAVSVPVPPGELLR